MLVVVITRAPMCLASWMAKRGDAACTALDQDGLAGFQPQRLLDRHHGREPHQRHRRRLDVGEAVGLARDDGGPDGELLGVAAFPIGLADPEDRIARAEIRDALAHGAHDAREVAAGMCGKWAG